MKQSIGRTFWSLTGVLALSGNLLLIPSLSHAGILAEIDAENLTLNGIIWNEAYKEWEYPSGRSPSQDEMLKALPAELRTRIGGLKNGGYLTFGNPFMVFIYQKPPQVKLTVWLTSPISATSVDELKGQVDQLNKE